MKKLHGHAFSFTPVFLGIIMCLAYSNFSEFGNRLAIQGRYHDSSNRQEVKFDFTTQIGPIMIANELGVKEFIEIESQPIPHSKNPEIAWWFSQPFQFKGDDAVTMNLQISGDYFASNPKKSQIINGSNLSVVVSLVEDSKDMQLNSLESFSLYPPESILNQVILYKIHYDFKNKDPKTFFDNKTIAIKGSNNPQLINKNVKIKLMIFATGIEVANLKITNTSCYKNNNKIDME